MGLAQNEKKSGTCLKSVYSTIKYDETWSKKEIHICPIWCKSDPLLTKAGILLNWLSVRLIDPVVCRYVRNERRGLSDLDPKFGKGLDKVVRFGPKEKTRHQINY